MICPYCNSPAALVSGWKIYPHRPNLFDKHFYECAPCDARVGCHGTTTNPLGRLANSELRRAKSAAHAAFDPIWKSKKMSRSRAYSWLAERLSIKTEDCHIGMFDVEQCRAVIAACKELKS